MASGEQKTKEAEKMVTKADKLTTLSFTRWAADWAQATPLYEQAGVTFKMAKQNGKAKHCFEKAAAGQERLASHWTAAKHLETAGQLAKEMQDWAEVKDLYKRASDLYMYCGKPQPAADALVRAARAVEDVHSDDAVRMYIDSCSILEDDGREQMAFDTYRAAANLHIKLKRFPAAASMLMRWGQAADRCKAIQSQCKAYVGAVIVYLFAGDIKAAQQCFNDCLQINAFSNSEQCMLAESLLKAYKEGDGSEIAYVVKSSKVIPHLDHMIVRLAKQLPTDAVKSEAGTSNGDALNDPNDPNDDELL